MQGQFLYKNIPVSQHPNINEILANFLRKEDFSCIIEIGTANGGLSLFFRDILPKAKVITYDIFRSSYADTLIANNIEIRTRNVFSSEYDSVIDSELLSNMFSANKLLIAVDGGNKIKEFNCLAPYMMPGQFIMCHDYAVDEQYFNENIKDKIWNWMEITEKDIQNVCTKYFLGTVYPELNQVVWQCKRKVI